MEHRNEVWFGHAPCIDATHFSTSFVEPMHSWPRWSCDCSTWSSTAGGAERVMQQWLARAMMLWIEPE